jgi:hypothetical protein
VSERENDGEEEEKKKKEKKERATERKRGLRGMRVKNEGEDTKKKRVTCQLGDVALLPRHHGKLHTKKKKKEKVINN